MKTVYVCNVSNSDEPDDVLKLPSTQPKNHPFKGAEQVRRLHADPAFGAGSDEEPLPMPTTYEGKGEVAS